MPSCVALNCVTRTGGKVSLFCFPHHDEARMCQWVRNTKRRNWKPSPNSRICALHFTEDCFHSGRGRRKLNSTAVPTIFPFSGVKTTSKTPMVSVRTEVSDAVFLDHSYSNTGSSSTSAEVNTELSDVVNTDQENNTTSQTAIQEGDHDSQVADLSSSDATDLFRESPNTHMAWHKLHSEIQTVAKQLVISRKKLKLEKQKTRRLNKKISWLTDVIRELQQKMREMRKTAPKAAAAPRLKRLSDRRIKKGWQKNKTIASIDGQ